MTGLITTIQRMSMHDGPGIRSTVFLKGCNFRCKWCHNPETWSCVPQLQLIRSRCISCGSCIEVCNNSALCPNTEGIILDRTRCTICGKCTENCVSGALTIVGRYINAEELAEEIIRDKEYYDESGGGLTLSGGEPLLQISFIEKVLQICKQHAIHATIESNLSVEKQQIEKIMPFVDLWMVDLKFANDELHRKWTGVSNKQTIDNLRFLSDKRVKMIVRTPVIPGINDTPEEIVAICEILKELTIEQYELIPFHPLGFNKFCQLGIDNPLTNMTVRNMNSLEELNCIINDYNLNK